MYTIEFQNRWFYYGTIVMAGIGTVNTVVTLLMLPFIPWILHYAPKVT